MKTVITGQAIYVENINGKLENFFDEETAIKEMVAADKVEVLFNERWSVGLTPTICFTSHRATMWR